MNCSLSEVSAMLALCDRCLMPQSNEPVGLSCFGGSNTGATFCGPDGWSANDRAAASRLAEITRASGESLGADIGIELPSVPG